MKQVKCECGHVNPVGTVLCESCGRALQETQPPLADMRYDGSARRSQTYNKTIIDKIWNFFSSVKVGIWLIVITLAASAFGTIFPQEAYLPPGAQADTYYEEQYGTFGQLYYLLGFHHLYGSWWYLLLIASIGISLVICSLDRVIPLYRALKNQGVRRSPAFLRRQRLFSETDTVLDGEAKEKIAALLKKKHYRIRAKEGSILAEKGRFSRWGPYVNHIGLIIFLIGAMLRFVPGMYVDETLWVREGETAAIPGTDGKYYLKNNQFSVETYNSKTEKKVFADAIDRVGDGRVAKNFQTDAVLYKREGKIVYGEKPNLKKVTEEDIRVNQPLRFDSFSVYQVDYKENQLDQMVFQLIDKKTKKSFGSLKINLLDPDSVYDLGNGYKVEIASYLPDFYFNQDGEPSTKTKIPNNPAFVFNIITPDKPKGEKSFVAIQETIEGSGSNKYKLKFDHVETKNITGLTVRKDLTLWVLAVGGAIFMIGVIQGMYWQHRRIWLHSQDGTVMVAGHTNKNWYGLKRDLAFVLADSGLTEPEDQKELIKTKK
ncbi:cytochrome c biogenesis protein ResB [Bacillus spizizenii]|uniref:cytochrome c biogenesis protein ResB n=1 Tax=Bacillus spizizenii TaxID=96241 RepID=UPI0005C97ADF|nr:cytochrome c biogenesis protein ResB [Bacillus spizizenii]MCY8602741.1 cytochrome c biogenesis protein ResB [Bacillus spizizenii]MCY8636166.1 cytochrome c biogenesis protein ResB [Bacillus spizizenii]MCY8766168.1 cytochrome c biogenesis protein ResB [Bacillus spizizenii]MCY8803749.1 cytochrome c biogenesis protein ResB [Bacillus spizizenii]MEC0571913.1 cytochrome c biogenesis protein ResB [Bacillus spizizenii]